MEIPETIKTQQLIKDLAKEIRLVEVQRSTLVDVVCGVHIIVPFYTLHILLCFRFNYNGNIYFPRTSFSKTLAVPLPSSLGRRTLKVPPPLPKIPSALQERRGGPNQRMG